MADRTRPPVESAVDESFQVYVGGIDQHVQKEQLQAEFARFGAVKSVWVAYNPPGFGFVRFHEKQDAEEACSALNSSIMFGQKVRVEMSDMSRGKGGGGRGGERGRGRGRGQPYNDTNRGEPRYDNYPPTRQPPRGYGSVRSRGRDFRVGGYREREYQDGGYGERDYRPAREVGNAYRDREYRPAASRETDGYRDRPARGREYRPAARDDGSGYRDREYRPSREQDDGYRDREYRPVRAESNGYRDRDYRPARDESGGFRDRGYNPSDKYKDREYNPPRENGDGNRSRDYKLARSDTNGYRDRPAGREADRYTPPRDFRTPRDHEDRDYKSRSGGNFSDRSRDGDYRDRDRASNRGARDRRSSPFANRPRGNYRATRSPRNRSRSPVESRESARDRSWENYWEGPQNNSRTKY